MQFAPNGFTLSALPKRWISVTAPVRAVLHVKPAFLVRCVAMTRYTIPSTFPMIAGRLANRNRNGYGKLSTHWRTGLLGKDIIDQQRGAFRHTPRATAGAKRAALTTKRHEAFVMTGLAAHA